MKPYRFIIFTEWNVEPFVVEVNNIKAVQPTCLVASDSCCSILSTTFLKGGLLKGSGSQQDLIIWYLHSGTQTHTHTFIYLQLPHTLSCFVGVYCFSQKTLKSLNMSVFILQIKAKCNRMRVVEIPQTAFLIVSSPPSFQLTSTVLTCSHNLPEWQLTFHWVRTPEHPFCILLLLICRTWRPRAYQDMDCFLHSAGRFSYIMQKTQR